MGLNEAVIDRLGLSSVETCSMPRQSAAHDAKVSGGLETWMEDDHILCVQAEKATQREAEKAKRQHHKHSAVQLPGKPDPIAIRSSNLRAHP